MPDTEAVQHQLAQQELEGQAALSYEEYLRRLTQAVDTEVSCSTSKFSCRKVYQLFRSILPGLFLTVVSSHGMNHRMSCEVPSSPALFCAVA